MGYRATNWSFDLSLNIYLFIWVEDSSDWSFWVNLAVTVGKTPANKSSNKSIEISPRGKDRPNEFLWKLIFGDITTFKRDLYAFS